MTPDPVDILLVEDNAYDAELTLMAFRDHKIGNQVQVVRDGEEALEYLFCTGRFAGRPQDEHPKMVLLDIKLPKVDGLEVLRAIKSDPRTRRIPVVMLTSSSEESDIVAGYDGGTNSYIIKPVDFDQFRDVVQQLGLYWLVANTAAGE